MDGTVFINEVKKAPPLESDDNVFDGIFGEFERIVLQSLITSFGLDFLVKDQYGGDVDTVLNVRKIGTDPEMKYKNRQNEINYQNRGEYNSDIYHKDERYIRINKKVKEKKLGGSLIDSYTGKRIARNAKVDLDHIISAKEIHDDPGRVLAGLSGVDLANSQENLTPTDRSINRSMKERDIDDYLNWLEAKKQERGKRIIELKGKNSLSEKEKKEMEKLEKQEDIDPELMHKKNEEARRNYNGKIAREYYTSQKFVKDTASAARKRGAEMAMRQALGFVFVEIWICTRDEIKAVSVGAELKDIIIAAGDGIKKGFERVKTNSKELFAKIEEGFSSGALASLTTTICNIFFTTAEKIVKCIRQIYASVIQAGKVLLFNPDNLLLGDRLKKTMVILATGASVLIGTVVGELIENTPIGKKPIIGKIVTVFCSSMVSGLLSCCFLVFLDRSKLINHIIDALNRIPSEVNNYCAIADAMEALAAKLTKLEIEEFRREAERYEYISVGIENCQSEAELNTLLLKSYETLGMDLPWRGDFDSFMENKKNRLVFG